MSKAILSQYTEYNVWANETISDKLSELNDDIINSEIKSSFPSLRKTIFHIWDAEFIWLNRLKGNSINYWPSSKYDDGTPFQNFLEISNDFRTFINDKDEDFFHSFCNYTNTQ